MEDLRSRLEGVLERIERAARSAGRDPGDVRLIAVSKSFPPEIVREARSLGLRDFGENRAQELRFKYENLRDLDITWHFIGRIQSNKIKIFVPIVEYVHSLWREKEALEMDKRAGLLGKRLKVFVEVNVSGEESKAGVEPEKLREFLRICSGMKNLEIIGLMTMAPLVEDPEKVRWVFRKLRDIRDELSVEFPNLKELSMGMSNDFEVAIQEGATFIRVGTAVFGPRT